MKACETKTRINEFDMNETRNLEQIIEASIYYKNELYQIHLIRDHDQGSRQKLYMDNNTMKSKANIINNRL